MDESTGTAHDPGRGRHYGLVDESSSPQRSSESDRGVMFRGVHHLGFTVTDLDEAVATSERLFGATLEPRDAVAEPGMEEDSLLVGASRMELLGPFGDDAPVGRLWRSADRGAPRRVRGRRRRLPRRPRASGAALIDPAPP